MCLELKVESRDTVISSTTEAEYMAAVVSIEGSSVVVRIGPGNSTSGRIHFGFMEMIR